MFEGDHPALQWDGQSERPPVGAILKIGGRDRVRRLQHHLDDAALFYFHLGHKRSIHYLGLQHRSIDKDLGLFRKTGMNLGNERNANSDQSAFTRRNFDSP